MTIRKGMSVCPDASGVEDISLSRHFDKLSVTNYKKIALEKL